MGRKQPSVSLNLHSARGNPVARVEAKLFTHIITRKLENTMTAQNIKCIVVKQKDMGDYWTIERAEHDGRSWIQPMGRNCVSFCVSARLGEPSPDPNVHNNADIEGTSSEVLAIAQAIETGGDVSFRRCEVVTTPAGVELMSPRNMRFPVLITHECAKALAADIRAKVRG